MINWILKIRFSKSIHQILRIVVFIFIFHSLFLVNFICLVGAMDPDLWNLPEPPDSRIIWKDSQLEINGTNVWGTHIRSKLSIAEIIDFYQDFLLKNKWKVKDYSKGSNLAVFIKENTYIYIMVQYNGESRPCDAFIIKSYSSLPAGQNFLINYRGTMTKDSPGKDLIDVPAYPTSRRMISVITPQEGAVLTYQVDSRPQDVASFYMRELKNYGWQLVKAIDPRLIPGAPKEATAVDIAVLIFEKDKNNLVVLINHLPIPGLMNNKCSLITITKNIERELPLSAKEVE